MACGKVENSCGKTICDVYNELLDLIGDVNIIPNDTNDEVNIGNKLKFLYEKISDHINKSDYEIVDSTNDMTVDGRLYILRPTKSLYGVFNGTVIALSSGTSSNVESDPIYQADKVNLARKSEVTPIAEKLNDLVEATTIVNDKLEHEITARFEADENLQEQIENEINDRFDSETDLQEQIENEISARENADTTLNDKLTNETVVRSAADTLALNKINANTSQISANTTSITTNKNLQDLVNTQYLNKITALENKTGKLIVTKNTGETDAQALARVITAPVDGMAAFVYDPNAHGNSDNLTEYLRINGAWIEQGTHTATVDLTAYYTKTESDAKFIDTIELQNLFNSYFDWLGAKTFTVGDRLPDATAQPTTGVLADVGKITTWENQDWMLFEINQAGTLTYSWLPVAQGGSLSKGDTLHRDSVVEYFTTPDALKNIKILAGDLDTINYTFAEGVSGNLEVAPNASGNISIGHFNLNKMDAVDKALATKNNAQDTAIAGKQDTLTSVQLTNIGDVQNKQPKTLTTPLTGYTATDVEGTLSELDTKKQNALTQAQLTNINDIANKQPKTIALTGITATNVEGALVELAHKGGGISNPIDNFTNGQLKFMVNDPNANNSEFIVERSSGVSQEYLKINQLGATLGMKKNSGYFEMRVTEAGAVFYNNFNTLPVFIVTSTGKHKSTATHTINELLDKVDTNYANIGTSPASPIDIENQIFEDLETESKTLVGAMNEILHMVKALQGK